MADKRAGVTRPTKRASAIPEPQREPRSWTFRVPIDPSTLSHNQRIHPQERARRVKRARLAAEGAWQESGRPVARCRVRLDFAVYRGRKLDEGTVIDGCKALVDGLCGLRYSKHPVTRKRLIEPGLLTPDDGPEWVTFGEVQQHIGRCFAERPEVMVRAVEDPIG